MSLHDDPAAGSARPAPAGDGVGATAGDEASDGLVQAYCRPAFRDGLVHVLMERCSSCIFRPGNLMALQPGRLAGLVKGAIAADSAIICHQTLPYGGYDVPGQAVCRGFADHHGDAVVPLRLARAFDMLRHVAPPDTQRLQR